MAEKPMEKKVAPAPQTLDEEAEERDHLRSLLEKREDKYRTLFEESRDAVVITTLRGDFIEANQSALDLFGYSRKALMSMSFKALYIDRSERKQFQKEMLRLGYVEDFEAKLERKDGTVATCLISEVSIQADDGTILGFQGIVRDVTIERQRQRDLLESEEKYRTILESIEDGYYEVDLDINLTFFSEALSRISSVRLRIE